MKYLIMLICCLLAMNPAIGQDKKKYKKYKKAGDAYFESGAFLKASESYSLALKNKRGDGYATTKMKESTERANILFESSLKKAEQLFDSGQRDEAKIKFQEALRWKPGDAHIKTLIESCDIAPGTTFLKNFGGRSYDEARSVVATEDGGYLVAGRASGATSSNTNISVVKLDRDGNRVWEKSFGADETEEANDIIATSDGNFLVVGHSDSYGGGPGMKDMWAIKLDKQGNEIWSKNFGSNSTIDEARAVIEGHDGGYLLIGSSFEETSLNLLAVKISNNGDLEWKKSYGGEGSEEGNAVLKTDDGYTIVGNTESKGAGKWDIWMVHIGTDGAQKWDATYGGGDNETGNALVKTTDGGYLVAGSTYSFSKASQDMWIVRTDSNGKQAWTKNFGGVAAEEAFSLVETPDGEFVAAGFTEIWDETQKSVGEDGHDVFLVKFNDMGTETWARSFGGLKEQRCFDATALKDGSLLVVGLIHTDNTEGTDMLVIKTSPNGLVVIR